MGSWGKSVVAAVLLVTLAGRAPGNEPVSPEAKRQVDLAVQHYEAQRWKEASEAFELAYRLSHRPALLFNIARCEAKLGHDEAAIAFLKRYLEERPDAPDAPSVLAEIEAREQSLANTKARHQAEADAEAARKKLQEEEARLAAEREQARVAAEKPKVPPAALAPEPAQPNRTLRAAGIALLVTGPVLVGVGIGMGALARSAATDLMNTRGDFATAGASIQSRGQAANAAGIALDVLGGVAAVTGAALLGVSYKRRGAAAEAWLAPAGAGLVAGGRF